jgi:hypothetical protein
VKPALRIILAAQGAYYLVTGAWPLVSMESFELVTGPKLEHWLVYTVSLLALVIGTSLVAAARTGEAAMSIRVLALGTAAAFAATDFFYVSVGRISAVYLLDGAAELAFAIGIVIALVRDRLAKTE